MPQLEDSVLKLFASLTPAERETALREARRASSLSEDVLKAVLLKDWRILGRPKQQAPPGDWTYWWIRAGRGFGKTLGGAQWVKQFVLEEEPGCRFGLIASTFSDGRDTLIEGETGLLSILPAEALYGQSRETAWKVSRGELRLANGSRLRIFSSERPDRLRGPQFHGAWCEEISSWRDAHKGDVIDTTWSNVKLACRLGEHPRMCITSTPKPNKLTRALMAIPGLELVTGSSYENRDNLSEQWWREVIAPYEGTRLGLQEIHAQILEDVEGALWTLALIDDLRVDQEPDLARIVVGVDPNASSDEAANSAGVIVAGRDGRSQFERHAYVLADRTITRGGPRAWAQAAVDAYHDFKADLIIAEKNQGGEMVEVMLKTVDPTVPVKLVSASRGKRTRAEPIASLYVGSDTIPGRVHHVGSFPDLESEQTTWTPDADSPDRMDALVWALTELMLGGREGGPMRIASPVGSSLRVPLATDRQGILGVG